MLRNSVKTGNFKSGVPSLRRRTISRRLLIAFTVLALIPTVSISFVAIYSIQQIFIIEASSRFGPQAVIEILKVTTAVSFLLTFFFAYKLARRISLPMVSLGNTAGRISGGEFDLAAEIEQEDEIGDLARSINRMTARHLNLMTKYEKVLAEKNEILESRSLQLATIAEAVRDAGRLGDTGDLLNNTVSLISERLGGCWVGIYLLDENLEYADLKAAAGEAGQELLEQPYRLKVEDEGLVRTVFDSGKNASGIIHPFSPDSRSEVLAPLKIGEKITGGLEVQSSDENVLDNEAVIMLHIIADQLALAVEHANIQHQREFIQREIETAYGHYTLSSWQDYMKRSALLSGYRFQGEGPEPAGEPEPESREAWQGEMVVKTYTGLDKLSSDLGVSQTIAIPMQIRGQTIGVTNIKVKGGETAPETIALFSEIVNRLSLTLENVRLLEEAQLRGEQLHLLQEITADAAAHVNLSELLDAVCKRILEGFRLSSCGVLMLNEDRTESTLVIDEQAGPAAGTMRGTKIQIEGNEALQEFIVLQRSGISDDVQTNPSTQLMQEFFTVRGTHMLLTVPLTSRGETVGLILMESDDQNRRFREDDLRLADQIGLQVSTAIDVAQLFEQTERRAEKEKVISEVTTHIRETLDIETVLKTAAREMRRALNLAEVEIRLGTGEMLGHKGETDD